MRLKVIMFVVAVFCFSVSACGAAPPPDYILATLPMDTRLSSRLILDVLSEVSENRVILFNADLGYMFLKTVSEKGQYVVYIPRAIESAPDYMYSQIIKNTIDPMKVFMESGWKQISFSELPSELKQLLTGISTTTTWSVFVENFLTTVSSLGNGMFSAPLFMIIPPNFEDQMEIFEIKSVRT